MRQQIVLPYNELCSAYLAGQSTVMLARRYGCSPTTIAKNLRRWGITPRPSRFAAIPVDQATLRHMYLDQHLPIAAIAAYFGVSPSTVGNKRRRYGIPVRPRQTASAVSSSSQL